MMKLFLSFVSLGVFCKTSFAVNCIVQASGGAPSRCAGATYCASSWSRVNSSSTWQPESMQCVDTNLPTIRYLNVWRQPTVNVANFRCDNDYCNTQKPPANISSPPPQLTCLRTSGNGTDSCIGDACTIFVMQGQLYQSCASFAFERYPRSLGRFCIQYQQTQITSNGQSNNFSGIYCACRDEQNCNSNQLLSFGVHNVNPPAANCYLPGKLNNAPGQYCAFSKYLLNSQETDVYVAINSTVSSNLIPLGCSQTNTGNGNYTSCTCSQNQCNRANLIPTAWPTGFPHNSTAQTIRPSGLTTRPSSRTGTWHPWTRFSTWRPTWRPTIPPQHGAFMVLLENFDNSAGGGYLFQGKHCDPFWFSGVDQCDISLSVCVEPLNSDQSIMGCATNWIELGQVTNNNNLATLNPGSAYGGWTNPMQYPLGPFARNGGFQFKYAAFDIDNGGRQMIDGNVCSVRFLPNTPGVSFICQHMRPNGYQASMKLSYFISVGEPGPHPSGRPNPSWTPHHSGRPHPSGGPHPSGRPHPNGVSHQSWRPFGNPMMETKRENFIPNFNF